MLRIAAIISISDSDKKTLQATVRAATSFRRDLFRARIILLAADGAASYEIADEPNTRPTTVSQWPGRFSRMGLAGLLDAPRPGKEPIYTDETEKRNLAELDEEPPESYSLWNDCLFAEALGDASDHHVWCVLRKHGISLEKRRSWCVSTNPEFEKKSADIVGLCMSPLEKALVLCIDEKPAIQALARAQGDLKRPNGKAFMGYALDHTRHGTTSQFTTLEIATGQEIAGRHQRRQPSPYLYLMNEFVATNERREIHAVLDNLNTHKPKNDQWLQRHKTCISTSHRLTRVG